MKCIICGNETNKPIRAAFSHFYLYYPGQLQFLKGNIKAFGLLRGINSTLKLCCPAYNTLRHWKHRKSKLIIPPTVTITINIEED